jgi:2-dehydropantoate 2-reductase
MRYVVVDAGAIGSVIAGLLAEAGRSLTLVARGRNLDRLRTAGLRLATPASELKPSVAVTSMVDAATCRALRADDVVVILAVKSQDTLDVLGEIAGVAPPGIAVVCAQNGVANEPAAVRAGFAAYGAYLAIVATHVDPNLIALHTDPVSSVIDVGRYPAGVDETATAIATDLRAAGLNSRAQEQIMRWKYAKLLSNLGNAVELVCGRAALDGDLLSRARAEARECYRVAGIEAADDDERLRRTGDALRVRPVGGIHTPGSSSWQSLARRTGSIETDWLNGEIVLLGRKHAVATPVNEALRRIANRMARERARPGSYLPDDVAAEAARIAYEDINSAVPPRRVVPG